MNALILAAEDAADLQAVQEHQAAEAAAGGYQAAKAGYYTGAELLRIIGGDSPVRVWREKRGMTQRALAAAANLTPSYLNEIEMGKKPGSLWAYQALAAVLAVKIDDLVR